MLSSAMTAKNMILALALLATAAMATATTTWANAPGGAYVQCDPSNPQSPVRCTADGW
jgi:hypothetical protein